MSSTPSQNAPPRLSFAEVAKAANKSLTPRDKLPALPALPASQSREKECDRPAIDILSHSALSPVTSPSVAAVVARPEVTPAQTQKEDALLSTMTEQAILHNGHVQPQPKETLLTKRDTSDTKSVTSRTTGLLDEKESLRPDDSASMQAATERDSITPPESAVAEPGPISASDPHAFRDQLQEIAGTESKHMAPANEIPTGRGPHIPISVIMPSQPKAPAYSDHSFAARAMTQSSGPPEGLVLPPDEKLREALASPKDRLFVLKIEQDMIDFIKDPRESDLLLPQTNSFYRMLSHKLAEYYFLGHAIDPTMTSVRIFKLPQTNSRLPSPLIKDDSVADGTTPPPSEPVRKIMRRRGTAGNSNDDDGEFRLLRPGTSAGSGSEEDKAARTLDKSASTLKDREARYAETRARIFKDYQENGDLSSNGNAQTPENEISRSSSTSGARKGKKSRRPKDDSFEARSAYSQYGPQTFAPISQHQPGPQNPYFNGVQASVPYPAPCPPYQPSMNPDYHQPQPWLPPQFMQTMPHYPQGVQSPGGLQTQSYEGMHGSPSYSSPDMALQTTPTPTNSSLSGYHQPYQMHPDSMHWSQGIYPPATPAAHLYRGDATMMPPHMGQSMYPRPYGIPQGYVDPSYQHYGFPGQPYHPNPQFNPRSQNFIPGMPSPGQSGHSASTYTSGPSLGFPKMRSQRSNQPRLQSSISEYSRPSTLPARPPVVASTLPNMSHYEGQSPFQEIETGRSRTATTDIGTQQDPLTLGGHILSPEAIAQRRAARQGPQMG